MNHAPITGRVGRTFLILKSTYNSSILQNNYDKQEMFFRFVLTISLLQKISVVLTIFQYQKLANLVCLI